MNSSPSSSRCFECLRPMQYCYCEQIPLIQNRTQITILQDRKERFHPFNTARMTHAALANSDLIFDRHDKLAEWQSDHTEPTGLLYPSRESILLDDSGESLDHLVVIDGTWNQAKRIVRISPYLQRLPKYHLAPTKPGEYRIRREPNETALSTVEATVAALRILEPETIEVEQLLEVFHSMVDAQFNHPKGRYGARYNQRRSGIPFNIPAVIAKDVKNVVVAYGESAGGERDQVEQREQHPRLPIYWVAERLGTGERFVAAIKYPNTEISEQTLDNLRLSRNDFENAISVSEFCESWNQFLKPSDHFAVYNASTHGLLRAIDMRFPVPLILKSIDLNRKRKNGALSRLLYELELSERIDAKNGRAGLRLEQAIVLVRHLHNISEQAMQNVAAQAVNK